MKYGDLVQVKEGPMWKRTGFVEKILDVNETRRAWSHNTDHIVVVTLDKAPGDSIGGHQILFPLESLEVIGYQV